MNYSFQIDTKEDSLFIAYHEKLLNAKANNIELNDLSSTVWNEIEALVAEDRVISSNARTLLAIKNGAYQDFIPEKWDDIRNKKTIKADYLKTKLLQIFPNPAKNKLQIISETDTEIIIYNLLGIIITKEKIYKGKNELDISKLSKGIYFIKSAKDNSITKFIKL